MADINNFSDINENFDTIKTLLNSIRAQGILNTSDVDKILENINSKLEKINTDEDINVIKTFLSELKKNLDERHNVLLSKFGAIESLFSNLLKNSNDAVKSEQLKELFDIIATNLSVFSREVVSQKETLTDITLRLDAMRSDDTQKKDIIKSVSTVRNDIEKLSNGFDSIVISLNENFKTVLKTISEVDQTEAITGFSNQLNDLIDSSSTILSAIQLIDKKNNLFEESFEGLATQDDTSSIQKNLIELSAKSQEITNIVDALNQKSYKIDNLAEKIDASVNIIAGLKAEIADKDDGVKNAVLDELSRLELKVKEISSNKDFENFKNSFESALERISSGSEDLKQTLNSAIRDIGKLNDDLKSLDISSSFQNMSSNIARIGEDVKEKLSLEVEKLTQMLDVNITRTLNGISSNAEVLNARLKESSTAITELCEKNFAEVSEGISSLKEVVAQLDENNVSANNAIFSNITDRLAIFENSLKTSLEKQEDFVSSSSSNVFEQITNMKNVTEGIDYKLDSSAIELGSVKREFVELKDAVDNVLALDFVNAVKDIKVDLYAIQQDLNNAIDSSSSELSEKYTNDLFSKYELLISKLDSVEDELKYAQAESLNGLQESISKISSSIVDILSYVSNAQSADNSALEAKLLDIAKNVKDSNLNYVENVRDIVDVIRAQVEKNLQQISEDTEIHIDKISSVMTENNDILKQDIKNSYDKLVEVQNNIYSINEAINNDKTNLSKNIEGILDSAENLKSDFEYKMTALKNSLLDIVTDFKKDFTCENADKINEIKFNAETLNARTIQQSVDLKNELKTELDGIIGALRKNISGLNEHVSNTSLQIESANKEVIGYIKNDFTAEVNESVESIKTNTADVLSEIDTKVYDVVNSFSSLEVAVNNLSSDTTSALSSTLSKILDNFVALHSLISSIDEQNKEMINSESAKLSGEYAQLQDKYEKIYGNVERHLDNQITVIDSNYTAFESLVKSLDDSTKERFRTAIVELKEEFSSLKNKFTEADAAIDEDLARQISIIEGSFESINLMMVDVMNQATDSLGDKIKKELNGVSNAMTSVLAVELEKYKSQIEDLFDDFKDKSNEQGNFIKGCALELNDVLESTLSQQNKDMLIQLEEVGVRLKDVLDKNIELTSADYSDLKEKLSEFLNQVEKHNIVLVDSVRAQLDDITKFVDSNLDIQAQEVNASFEEISSGIQKIVSTVRDFNGEIEPKLSVMQTSVEELKTSVDTESSKIINNLEQLITTVSENTANSLHSNIDNIRTMLKDTSDAAQNAISITSEAAKDTILSDISELRTMLENTSNATQIRIGTNVNEILNELSAIQSSFIEQNTHISTIFFNELKPEMNALSDKINNIFGEHSNVVLSKFAETNVKLSDDISAAVNNFILEFANLNDRLDKDELARMNVYQVQIDELGNSFKQLINDAKEYTKNEITALSETLITNNSEKFGMLDQTLESYVQNISNQVENVKQNSVLCKDLITNLLNEHLEIISKNIEKETDVIVGDVIEQFSLFKDIQKDELSALSSAIEGSVAGYVIDAVNDLKSYMDIKTDSSVLNSKLDTLRTEIEKSLDETTENINKLLEVSVFTDAITDLRMTNEVLLTSMSDKLNNQIQSFVKENISKHLEEKINILDKKFIETVVDKYEEIKLIANEHTKSFKSLTDSISELTTNLVDYKDEINANIDILLRGVNKSIDELKTSFAELKAQILNKSFDEAFHASVHNQISGIEKLINEQLGYMEDISDLCCANLPELSEMNTIVKFGIQESIKDLKEKYNQQGQDIANEISDMKSDIKSSVIDLNEKYNQQGQDIVNEISDMKSDIKSSVIDLKEKYNQQGQDIVNEISDMKSDIKSSVIDLNEKYNQQGQDITNEISNLKSGIRNSVDNLRERLENQESTITTDVTKELNTLKSDIITQFINVFNQISFISEQEEILDFIQEKHSELITILSHIVTTSDGIETVKDNVAVVDNKLDSLKEDIDLINEKITSIMSSDGDIDYVYSLQDLESDIANLRLVLNDMKADNKSKEFEELINSTNNIYQIVETIKTEMPRFEAEEFKKDFNELAEDIVSISTRTNKLLLTSDESYKTLQDNLQDFRLVINDLDERTKNFAQSAGIDKIDNKLTSINTMIQNGAKTNQVFNQVFEYLAEWVDKAGEQITAISDKVDTLDDISQIKLMLEDLRTGAQDNSESQELVDALTTVFDKQARKIASLEAKLDRIIVDSKINSKQSSVDIKPIEKALNKFLSAFEDKIALQHDKISLLETKMEEVASLIDNKDTAQLSKKVGGMDRQLAKLNKSIEKIASNVVEK